MRHHNQLPVAILGCKTDTTIISHNHNITFNSNCISLFIFFLHFIMLFFPNPTLFLHVANLVAIITFDIFYGFGSFSKIMGISTLTFPTHFWFFLHFVFFMNKYSTRRLTFFFPFSLFIQLAIFNTLHS